MTTLSIPMPWLVSPGRLPTDRSRRPGDGLTMAAAVHEQDHHTDDVRRAKAGDPDAFARLVRVHQQDVARRLWQFTRDRGRLDELVHDTFVEAWMSLPKYRGDAPLEHWLARIATRVGYRHWKQEGQRRDQQTMDIDSVDPATPIETASDAAEQVHRLLAQLPVRDRLVLTLLYLEELTVQEAATMAGWSVTMVKVQAFRARRKLQKLVNEQEPKS